jgi:hypothetical protein
MVKEPFSSSQKNLIHASKGISLYPNDLVSISNIEPLLLLLK